MDEPTSPVFVTPRPTRFSGWLSEKLVGLLIALFTAVGALLLVCVVLAMGWLLSRVFAISVFEGAALIGSTIGVAFLALSVMQVSKSLDSLKDTLEAWLFDDGDEEDEFEDDEDEKEPAGAEPGAEASAGVAGSSKESQTARNAPCPCGSGRKFKRCHGERPTH